MVLRALGALGRGLGRGLEDLEGDLEGVLERSREGKATREKEHEGYWAKSGKTVKGERTVSLSRRSV